MAKRPGINFKLTRQLLQIGVLSARLERYEQAEKIIRAVKAFRTDLPHPGSALATVYLFQTRYEESARELESVLATFPNHQLGRALLGLMYRELGRPGWRSLSQQVLEDGREEAAMGLARFTLDIEVRDSAPLPPSRVYA
jgi:tetratricopeptide (TPR) repeat protein